MKRVKLIAILIAIVLCFGNIDITAAPAADIGINSNVPPAISLSITPAKKPVDIVILTDYTGSKLTALNTQINALKANFAAVDVDPVFHVINDVKKIGTQNDELYEFVRYGRFTVTYSSYKYYFDYGLEESAAPYVDENLVEWERIQGLKSQYLNSTLPERNPQNVYYTKSSLKEIDEADLEQKWYDVYIKCDNDPSHFGDKKIKEYVGTYINIGNHHRKKVYGSIVSEVATVDATWTIEDKISDVSYDIYSLNFDKLNTISLRTGSDRYMLFISDATLKDYSKSQGNYFSFGNMTDTLKNYIKNNNFSIYGVVPDIARYRTLYPDKVVDIVPLHGTTIFYMQNGQVLKLGDKVKNDIALNAGGVGETVTPDETTAFGDIKQKIIGPDNVYYLMANGKIKYFDGQTNQIVTYSEVTNISKMYRYNNYNDYLIVTTAGKIFEVNFETNTKTNYNIGVAITDIVFANNQPIFLTASGEPYVEYTYRDTQTNTATTKYTKLQIGTEDKNTHVVTYTDMPNVKNIESYTARATAFSIKAFVVLYTSGKIQQFTKFDYYTVYSGVGNRYKSTIPYVVYETNDIGETGVKSIESCNTGVFVFKTNGSVRLVNCNYVDASYEDEEDGIVHYRKPSLKDTTVSVPLSNIIKTQKTSVDRYFLTDGSNNTYMYDGTYECKTPVLGTTLRNLGKIKDIAEFNLTYTYIYVLQDDGRVREFRYNDKLSNNTYHFYEEKLLSYKNIEKMYSSMKNLYLLDKDGRVLGKGYNRYGSLGQVSPWNYVYVTSFVDPFPSKLTFDTSITHYSLLDIFNAILNSKFYDTGQYAAAFNDIYKNYGDFSGTGTAYVVLGEDIEYQVSYSDYENDPEYSRQWKITHDPYYYDNSMGLSSYHNPAGFTSSPPVKLDKVGKYVINVKARDNPKSDDRFDNYRLWSLGEQNISVYVHRKPVALQRVSVVDNGDGSFCIEAFDAGSYDLDHNISRADKGIVAREWRWKDSLDMAWHYERMKKNDCRPDRSYVLQLRVKDAEGVWSDYNTIEISDGPPVALFDIEKDLILDGERLLLTDKSYPQSFFPIDRWHWIVKKFDSDGMLEENPIQDEQFDTSNNGTGEMKGYDTNVKTDYTDTGKGKYRIFLRVRDSRGIWSNDFYYRDINVQESFKMSGFRVVRVKDANLESFYRNPITGNYEDKPMGVNEMAVDSSNFNYMVGGLAKGYIFEFEIDTVNFNDDLDSIRIVPHFYTCDNYYRDPDERDLYWENSRHEVLKAGEGGHADWAVIELTNSDRRIGEDRKATWRGSYLIPGTAWAVPLGTPQSNAKSGRISKDIIVNFEIKGYKDGVMKFDYNLQQWPAEREIIKGYYEVGDVIRYSSNRGNLDDIDVIINRP